MEGRDARYILGFCISVLTAVLLQCMEMQMGGVVLSVLMEPDILDCTQGAASFVQQELLDISELYRCEK